MDDSLREALDAGRAYYAKKEFKRAEPYLQQLIDEGVAYADVYNMMGVAKHHDGAFSKAKAHFEKALELNPGYTEASLNLAVTYNDMGRYQEAKELYLNALTSSASHDGKLDAFVLGKLANMYADIAKVYCTAGAFDDGIAEYRRALQLRPTFVDLRLRLAQALRDAGHAGEAVEELKTILQQSPKYSAARLNLGLALFSLGRSEEAVTTLQGLVTDEPDHPRAKLYLDMIVSHQNRNKEGS